MGLARQMHAVHATVSISQTCRSHAAGMQPRRDHSATIAAIVCSQAPSGSYDGRLFKHEAYTVILPSCITYYIPTQLLCHTEYNTKRIIIAEGGEKCN